MSISRSNELAPQIQTAKTVTITLAGEYDLATRTLLAEMLLPAETAEIAIIDVTSATYIDSSCLQSLLRLRNKLAILNGSADVRIVGARKQIARVFSVTGLDHVFSMYPTVADALEGAP